MMGDLSLINGTTSQGVETATPKTGRFDPVAVINPERGQFVEILNRVATGDRAGVPVYLDLADSNDNDLPADTEVVIGFKASGEDEYRHVSVKKGNIQVYNALSFGDQQNTDNIDRVKHRLKAAMLRVRDIDEAAVLVKSSTQADPSNSKVVVDGEAVERGSLE